MNSFDSLIIKLDRYIRKYYKNLLIKGMLYSLILLIAFFLAIVILEYFGHFASIGRSFLFYSYLIIASLITIIYVFIPLSKLYKLGDTISYEKAAMLIGLHFNTVQDKILNTLQLEKQKASLNTKQLELLEASIDQKMSKLNVVSFDSAIDLKENYKYLKRLAVVILLFLLISFIDSTIIFSSADRLLNYSKDVSLPLPFSYELNKKNLSVLEEEDFKLGVTISGKEVPDRIYIVFDDKKHYLVKKGNIEHEYLFRNVQKPISFYLTDGKNNSSTFYLKTIPRPSLHEFNVRLDYPDYTKLGTDSLNNIGDLEIPEGTSVEWLFSTKNVETVDLIFSDTLLKIDPFDYNQFKATRTLFESQDYKVTPKNNYSNYSDTSNYFVSIVKDQSPQIFVKEDVDSINVLLRYFSGQIEDDYGFSKLNFVYKQDVWEKYETKSLPIRNYFSSSSFYYFFDLSSLNLTPGSSVDYYFEVWDNDEVNGAKVSKTMKMIYNAPTDSEINTATKENNSNFKADLNKSIEDAFELRLELEKIKKDLLDKKTPDWQDQNRIENYLQKHQAFEETVNELKNKNESLSIQNEQYNKNSKEIKEKQELLNKLLEELMNDEMKSLFDELQDLLKQLDKEKLLNKMEDIEISQEDLMKELDRSLEQFKQLEFEKTLDNIADKLQKLAEKQEKLSEKTKDKADTPFNINKEEEKLKDDFNSLQKDIDDLNKLNDDLEYKHQIPDFEPDEESVLDEMEKSIEELDKNNNKKSSAAQKKAAEQMKKMAQKMNALKTEMQSESIEMDMKSLRQLLENLVQFSFDQESVIQELKNLNTRDPKYTKLGQKQQKLQEDVKIIEDSLYELSKRVPQLGPHINKEIISIKKNIERSIKNITERHTYLANSNQQYTMTSANNLALLLDELLKQMQNSLPGSGQCNKPGGNGSSSSPDIKKMMEQMKKQLSQMKEQMKGDKPGGKKPGESNTPGSKGSESLARLAAQQAALRKQIQELSQSLNEDGSTLGNGLKKIIKELEKVENDIINNEINIETINRQKEIMTKMLEHEKAMREQEKDNKRESKEIKDQNYSNPNQFLEYKRKKEKELELLKTIPPSLKPYYKNKVNDYFNILQY